MMRAAAEAASHAARSAEGTGGRRAAMKVRVQPLDTCSITVAMRRPSPERPARVPPRQHTTLQRAQRFVAVGVHPPAEGAELDHSPDERGTATEATSDLEIRVSVLRHFMHPLPLGCDCDIRIRTDLLRRDT